MASSNETHSSTPKRLPAFNLQAHPPSTTATNNHQHQQETKPEVQQRGLQLHSCSPKTNQGMKEHLEQIRQ
ncbi:hypothetical protein KC19_9G188600 [Ceratodon purpureus]|uniref:Uncharacterized protein n=1 Tax=Ceratodon purpureus TaxID=3225 RepID=A0A8T0GVF3_CERPU|nr:hypothetical protein KC19_9G188600 [Ceratodon purpureus]